MGNGAAASYWLEELTADQQANVQRQISQQYRSQLFGEMRYRSVYRKLPGKRAPEAQFAYSFQVTTGEPTHQKVEVLVQEHWLKHVFDRPFVVVPNRHTMGVNDICFVQMPEKKDST